MTVKYPIRLTAGALGLLAGFHSALHAYGAWNIDAPLGTIAVFCLSAVVEILLSAEFAMAKGRNLDKAFLFVFGVASILDIDRYLWTPMPSLFASPAAFLAGLIAYWWDFRKSGAGVS